MTHSIPHVSKVPLPGARSRPILRHFILPLLAAFALPMAGLRGEGSAAPQPSPAFAAEDFIESIGINGSPIQTHIYTEGPFKGAGRKYPPQVFYDLGIRFYREALHYDLTREDQPDQVLEAWKKSGARVMFLLSHNKTPDPAEAVRLLNAYDPRAVAEVEGPNEPNNKFPPQDLNHKYKNLTDERAAALYMTEFYQAIKADERLRSLPVVAYSAIFTDYNLAKGHTGFDFGNMHSYQNFGVPSSSLLMNVTRFNNIYPPGSVIKPIKPTECGYNIEADETNHTYQKGSLRAQARNIPMLLAEYFRHGIARSYLFALHNADGYGLVEGPEDRKRPSYFAVKSLLDEIRDARWNPETLRWEGGAGFTPRALPFTLEGATDTVHTLTLQKADGSYRVLIWNEVENYDANARRDLDPAPVPVRIRFGNPCGPEITLLTQNDAGCYDSRKLPVADGVFSMHVLSSVSVLRIPPGDVPAGSGPLVPQHLVGSSGHHQADLKWDPVAGSAGYFVFRNGWHIATVTQPGHSDRSAWLRPGLGYTYEVAAFDSWGRTSSRARTVVFTPNGRPDLVVTRIWSESTEPGKPAKLRATLRNIGDGPTPWDTPSMVTFFVNGSMVCFAGTNDVLNPGDERTIAPEGGTSDWKPAAAGSYLITAQADDINRISGERDESNNKSEWTLVSGPTTGGKLELHTEMSPFSIDMESGRARDWVVFGASGAEGAEAGRSVVRKAGADLIGEVRECGQGYLSSTAGSPVRLQWPGGSSNSGLWWNGAGHGVAFSVPTSPDEQTLELLVSGLSGSCGRLEVSLDDGSAPSLVSTVFNGNRGNGSWAPVPDDFAGKYVVRFSTSSAGRKLEVKWLLDSEPNAWSGQVRLQALILR